MTPTAALRETLALLEKATAGGEWEINDGYIAGPHFPTADDICLINASVNFLREHGPALLRDAESLALVKKHSLAISLTPSGGGEEWDVRTNDPYRREWEVGTDLNDVITRCSAAIDAAKDKERG
jgi:hypothetical protein